MDEQDKLSPDDIMAGWDPFDDETGDAKTLEDFPEQVRDSVEGLMFLGELYDDFEFCGHTFVIRTLRGDEELLAALVCKEFIESLGQARAWIWALVGMCLVSVDGDENFCPQVSTNKRDYARARFQYVTRKWYWPVAAHLNAKYAALQERQNEAIQRVEDLYKGSLTTAMPSSSSLSDQGDSEELTEQEDIREFLDPLDSTDSKPDSSNSSSDET